MLLGVNVDHVATVRQARYRGQAATFPVPEPDPVEAARQALAAGADGITAHLREDRRHIVDRDVARLRRVVPRSRKLNLEMSVAPDVVRRALAVRPDQATLVPERRAEVTTEGGLALIRDARRIADVVTALKRRGIGTSLFVDPDPAAMRAAAALGAEAVELHTGTYANVRGAAAVRELARLAAAARTAADLGLAVYAGHGLNYANAAAILRVPLITEANIGHSIVSRALSVGIFRAVREMKKVLGR